MPQALPAPALIEAGIQRVPGAPADVAAEFGHPPFVTDPHHRVMVG